MPLSNEEDRTETQSSVGSDETAETSSVGAESGQDGESEIAFGNESETQSAGVISMQGEQEAALPEESLKRTFKKITVLNSQERIGLLLEHGLPKAPSQVRASPNGDEVRQVMLRFVNNEPEATHFRVEQSVDGGEFEKIIELDEEAFARNPQIATGRDFVHLVETETTFTNVNILKKDRRRISVGFGRLRPGVEYCFRVRALEGARVSRSSDVACVTLSRGMDGCTDSNDCDDGEFCYVECGENAGTCEPHAGTLCTTLYDPVCGCDGQTYSNVCFAAARLVEVAHEGTCATSCLNNSNCAEDEFCQFDFAACGGEGTCRRAEETCDGPFSPVCGCDGRTYQSKCLAQAAGMSVAYNGICEAICIDDTDCATGEFCNAIGECLSTNCTDNTDCGFGRTCVSAPGECGGGGTCEVTPELCPTFYDPVCGCDGNTYSNACFGQMAGASMAHSGACQSGCTSDAHCDEDEFCSFPTGTCGGEGSCAPTGNLCPQNYDPVCGCDGNTYSNACSARSSGAAVEHAGPCESVCSGDSDCDDGNPCTEDTCQSNGECSNTPFSCDDGDECTINYCDPEVGCVAEPTDCDESTFQTSNSGRVTVGSSWNPVLTPGAHNVFGDFGQVGAVFDDEADFVVNVVEGNNNLPYPLAPTVDIFGGWTLQSGRGYASGSRFIVWSLLEGGSQFVAVHFSMNANYELTPTLMLAGDFTQPYGVVMQTSQFSGWSIEDGLTPESDSPGFLRGWVSGTPFFQDPSGWNTVWSSPLTFEFDVLMYDD